MVFSEAKYSNPEMEDRRQAVRAVFDELSRDLAELPAILDTMPIEIDTAKLVQNIRERAHLALEEMLNDEYSLQNDPRNPIFSPLAQIKEKVDELLQLDPSQYGQFVETDQFKIFLTLFLRHSSKSDIATQTFDREDVVKGQREIMKNIDLQGLEGITTSTREALINLLPIIFDGQDPILVSTAADPSSLKILDLGAGDGRIALPLAALGCQVYGMDLSPKMVAAATERTDKFTRSIASGQIEDPAAQEFLGASKILYPGQEAQRLFNKQLEARAATVPDRISIIEGDFFEFEQYPEAAQSGQIDACTIMWHTFGFTGNNPDDQLQVLKNVYNSLRDGGKIIIEMPDREYGGYGQAVEAFDQEELKKANTNTSGIQPYGSLVDAPSHNADELSERDRESGAPRYFPGKGEMLGLLAKSGFHEYYVESFWVTSEVDDKKPYKILENMFVAHKPYNQEQYIDIDYNKLTENGIIFPMKPMPKQIENA